MRLAARLKLGYYPLPEGQAPMLRARLAFPQEKTSALDPCGAAIAKSTGIKTIQGNIFDVRARVERLSLLYLNPPYDFEVGPLANSRMERLFLTHTFSWLQLKSILV